MHKEISVGFAVALPEGLVVPVIAQADTCSLSELAYRGQALITNLRSSRRRWSTRSTVPEHAGRIDRGAVGIIGVTYHIRRKALRKRYALWPRNIFSTLGTLSLVLLFAVACGSQPTSTPGAVVNKTPIKIGISLSLSGDFSADGKAFQQGYQLWADTINKHGGLLGRQVQLDILSDASSPTQVVTNYQKLITVDKVDLVFGPFSTLLTKPASVVANRYNYAMVEGAGGGPAVFNRGLHNVFDVSLSVANNLVSFTQYNIPYKYRPQQADWMWKKLYS